MEALQVKLVFVMGGSYFIGKKIVDCLVNSNYEIDDLDAPFNINNERKGNLQWAFYGKNKIEVEDYLTDEFNTRLTHLGPPYIYGENNYAQRKLLNLSKLFKAFHRFGGRLF